MAPWKSSDGGSIAKVGNSSYSGAYGTAIVSAVSNVRGVVIRTLQMFVSSGNPELVVGGKTVLKISSGDGLNAILQRELFVPGGQAVETTSGGGNVYMTYDIL